LAGPKTRASEEIPKQALHELSSDDDSAKVQPSNEDISQSAPDVEELNQLMSYSLMQEEFYKAGMDLHIFEQFFFHQYWFHLYFWTFYVIFAVLVTVSWYQWVNFMLSCKIGKRNIDNVSRYTSSPIHAGNFSNNSCWYYTTNASNPSNISTRPEYACIIYYTRYNGGLG